MQSLIKSRRLLHSLSSVIIRENVYKNALGFVCCNYHTIVHNVSLLDHKQYQLHNPITSNFNIRFKSKKKQKSNAEIYSDDEEEEGGEDDEILGKGIELKTIRVQSLRIDQLFKLAFNVSRTRLEKAFFENRLRVNGEKVKKKAAFAQIGDEVDLIKGPSKENQNLLEVNRIEILSVKPNDTMDGILAKVRKSKALVIENYPPPHSWKQAVEEEVQS